MSNTSTSIKDITFFTLAEVAEKTRVSERTLRRYIKDGKIRALKFGNRWKISDHELEKVLRVA